MNSIGIVSLITLSTAYMLTISFHNSYLLDTVILLQQQKSYFYLAEAFLAYGSAFYKQQKDVLTLPVSISPTISIGSNNHLGKIIISEYNKRDAKPGDKKEDNTYIQLHASFYKHDLPVAKHAGILVFNKARKKDSATLVDWRSCQD